MTADAIPFAFRVLQGFEHYLARESLLGDPGIHDPADFAWVEKLESQAGEIADEYHRLLAAGEPIPPFHEISHEQRPITADTRWRSFVLFAYGVEAPRNCRLCPRTAAAVRAIPGMKTAMFSILEPGKRLPPHRGPYKGLLRAQLGLEVPSETALCWIEVEGIRLHWQPGKVLVFDDTRQHSAANEAGTRRCVLFLDFLRPMRPGADRLNRALLWAVGRSTFGRRARKVFHDWYGRHGIASDA